MNKKFEMPEDRFEIKRIPLYKQATGVDKLETDKRVSKQSEVVKKNSKKKQNHEKMDSKKTFQCNFRLYKEQVQALDIKYAYTKENVSKMIREAIEMLLKYDDETNNEVDVTSKEELMNKGVQMNKDLLKALKLYAFENEIDLSWAVRKAVSIYLLKCNS